MYSHIYKVVQIDSVIARVNRKAKYTGYFLYTHFLKTQYYGKFNPLMKYYNFFLYFKGAFAE